MTGCVAVVTGERLDLRAEFPVQTRFKSFVRQFLGPTRFCTVNIIRARLKDHTEAKFDRNFCVAWWKKGVLKPKSPYLVRYSSVGNIKGFLCNSPAHQCRNVPVYLSFVTSNYVAGHVPQDSAAVLDDV